MLHKAGLKIVSAAVIQTFLFQQACFAGAVPAQPVLPPVSLNISASLASIDDAYQAPAEELKVVLIQDPHTNVSGQIHIAGAIEKILDQQKINIVFLEGGDGDASFNDLKGAPADERRVTGLSFLKKGELSGAEYLNLVSEKDFTLWGAEDMNLYYESLEAYRRIAAARAANLQYLSQIGRAADFLKTRIFNPDLQDYARGVSGYAQGAISTTDYIDHLVRWAKRLRIDPSAYPNLAEIGRIKSEESRIDFKKAQAEREAAADAEISLDDQKQIAEKYPELAKYFRYVSAAAKLEYEAALNEQKNLERILWDSLAVSPDEKSLARITMNLGILEHLFGLRMTPAEYSDFKSAEATFDIGFMTGFLNRGILDLEAGHDHVVPANPDCSSFLA